MPAQTGSIDLAVLNGVASYVSEKTVTAYVEDYQGHKTPVNYVCETKAIISGGNFYSLGSHDDEDEVEYSRIGIAGQGMDYKFYSQLPPGIQDLKTSFVFGQMGLHGDKITAYGGHTRMIESDTEEDTMEAVKYKPYGEYGPDYIELGRAEDIENADGTAFSATHSPDRNIMRVAGGWVNKKDALLFLQHYSWYGESGAWVRDFYNNTPVVCRPSWEYAPRERVEGGQLYVSGLLSNNKKRISFTIPLSRPIAPEVTQVELFGFWYIRQNGVTLISGEDVNAGTVDINVVSWGDAGVSIQADSSTAWSSAVNYGACNIAFESWGLNFY